MPDKDSSDKQQYLRRFIAEQADEILPILRFYVVRAGLVHYDQAETLASEVLNEVTVTALENAARFQPERGPRPWLLGIAANLIHRRQAALARLERREPLVGDLADRKDSIWDEEAFFDLIAGQHSANPEHKLLEDEALQRRLAQLAPADQEVLHLAVIAGFNGQELSAELGVSPGAARVRLHRALIRLRRLWDSDQEE